MWIPLFTRYLPYINQNLGSKTMPMHHSPNVHFPIICCIFSSIQCTAAKCGPAQLREDLNHVFLISYWYIFMNSLNQSSLMRNIQWHLIGMGNGYGWNVPTYAVSEINFASKDTKQFSELYKYVRLYTHIHIFICICISKRTEPIPVTTLSIELIS